MNMTSRKTYLRTIYDLTEGGEEETRTSRLSTVLDVSDASASEAVQKMEDDSLICRVPYRGFTLSPLGKDRAEDLEKRFDVLKDFFERIGLEQPGEEARNLENVISREAVERIEEAAERLQKG